ncbi:hypothetical protein [Pararhizobium sp.]|uniref:hypothetical protein n=1 Tax=Pararhizobium sp. TaxID=1977563 RepID=UPI003BAA38AF
MPKNPDFIDRQWENRGAASTLLADAIDSFAASGMDEHNAISALEDALQIRRVTLNIEVAQG